MNNYFEDTVTGMWFVNPILKNYPNLTQRTELEFKVRVNLVAKQTTVQILESLAPRRKAQEKTGVTINGIPYAGDSGNRQALQEAIAFMDDVGITEFPSWKDSDDVFHANHPLSDVSNAYRAIGARRLQLIEAESEYAEQIKDGTLTDLSSLVWP